jgi:small subunit ribosomal protein S20
LAHSKSALKRWRQSIEARDRNRAVKSRTRTLLAKALGSIGDESTAEEAVREAISALDKAAQKGVIHANAAARGKSRLLKRYNLSQANAVAAAASGQPAAEKAPARRTTATKAKAAGPAAKKPAAKKPAPKTTRSRTPKT